MNEVFMVIGITAIALAVMIIILLLLSSID